MSPRLLVTSSWVPALVTALAAVMVLLSCDVPVSELAAYLAYLGLGVALPGVFTWRLLLRRLHDDEDRRPTWFEDLSLGTALGFGVQLPFFLLGVAIGVPLLVLAFPVLALGLSATPLGRAVWALPTARVQPAVAWGLAAVSVYGLVWLRHNVFPLRPLSLPPYRVPGVDETFHQALIAEIAHHFPPEMPFLLDTRLDYHWFVHAQIATSRFLTDVDSVTMLRLVLPVALMLLIVAGLGAVAMRLAERPIAAVIAPALLVSGAFHLLGTEYPTGSFIEPFLTVRYVTSPSQTYGVLMSMPAVMLILEVLRPQHRVPRGVWVALAHHPAGPFGGQGDLPPDLPLRRARRMGGAAAAAPPGRPAGNGSGRPDRGGHCLRPGGDLRRGHRVARPRPARHRGRCPGESEPAHHPVTTAAMTATLLTSWLLYGVGAVGLLPRRGWLDARAVFLLVCVPAGITVGAAVLPLRPGAAVVPAVGGRARWCSSRRGVCRACCPSP